jgi:transcription elongation factor Elf1
MTTHQNPDGSFTCDVCRYKYKTVIYFEKHRIRHELPNAKDIECSYCSKIIENKAEKEAHESTHRTGSNKRSMNTIKSPSDKFQCPICEKGHPTTTKLRRHFALEHLKNNPFRCTVKNCSSAFGDYYYLKKHFFRVHSNPEGKAMKCQLCPSSLKTVFLLREHYRTRHKGEVFPGDTPLCRQAPLSLPKKGMKYNADLITDGIKIKIEGGAGADGEETDDEETEKGDKNKNHLDQLNNLKPQVHYVKLLNKGLLEDPVVIELKKKNPEGAKLIASLTVTTALRVPASKKYFQCSLCPWSTLMAVYLDKHMISFHNLKPSSQTPKSKIVPETITGDLSESDEPTKHQDKTSRLTKPKKKYSCQRRNVSFKTQSLTNNHENKEHGIKKEFMCIKCDLVFSSRNNYRQHLKQKHNKSKSIYGCPTCNKTFTVKTSLKKHMDAHNGVISDTGKAKCHFCDQIYSSTHTLKLHIDLVHRSMDEDGNEETEESAGD